MNMTTKATLSPDRFGLQKFGMVISLMVVVLFGMLFPWWLGRVPPVYWPWWLSSFLMTWTVLSPMTLIHLYRPWMKLGRSLNRVTTPLILAILYYLVLTPTGYLLRCFGTNHAGLRPDSSLDSYRIPSRKRTADSMGRPF